MGRVSFSKWGQAVAAGCSVSTNTAGRQYGTRQPAGDDGDLQTPESTVWAAFDALGIGSGSQ